MGVPVLPGVLSVRCPVCRAAPGRPCANRRGYLVPLGSHRPRETAWALTELAEAREVSTST